MLRMLMVVALMGSMSSLVHAKDVSAQQAGAEYAREALLKAEAEHQDNLKKVAESEKELAEAQKQSVRRQEEGGSFEGQAGSGKSQVGQGAGLAGSGLEAVIR